MKLLRRYPQPATRSPRRDRRHQVLVVGRFPFGHTQAEELRELARLRDEGIVTEEEFKQKQRQFLGI